MGIFAAKKDVRTASVTIAVAAQKIVDRVPGVKRLNECSSSCIAPRNRRFRLFLLQQRNVRGNVDQNESAAIRIQRLRHRETVTGHLDQRSEEHTSELQSHSFI